MKKILTLLMVMVMMVTLVACGETDSSQPDDTVGEAPKEEPQVEESNEFYFDGEVAEIEDVRIKITDTKVIPVGEKGNEHGEKPIFAIWYEATNKSDDDIDPMIAWIAIFEAIQDNDENSINTLNVGSLPDEAHLDSQLKTIKKDGTVENSISYELDDLETPVILVASQGVMGDEIGRKEYEIK